MWNVIIGILLLVQTEYTAIGVLCIVSGLWRMVYNAVINTRISTLEKNILNKT